MLLQKPTTLLLPNEDQRSILSCYFSATRFVYRFCNLTKAEVEIGHGGRITIEKLYKILTQLRDNPHFFWLKKVPHNVLQQAVRNYEPIYLAKTSHSILIVGGWKIKEGKLFIPGMKQSGIVMTNPKELEEQEVVHNLLLTHKLDTDEYELRINYNARGRRGAIKAEDKPSKVKERILSLEERFKMIKKGY